MAGSANGDGDVDKEADQQSKADEQTVSYNRCVVGTFSVILSLVKLALGAGLIICAVHGILFTKGDKEGFGMPYYVGGFITGPLLIIGALVDCCVHRKSQTMDVESPTGRAEFTKTVIPQSCCAGFTIFCSCAGVLIVVLFGMVTCNPDSSSSKCTNTNANNIDDYHFFGWATTCAPSSSLSICTYTINMAENKLLATLILTGLLVTIALEISTMYFVCCSAMLRGVREASKRDGKPWYERRRGILARVRIEYADGSGGTKSTEHQKMIVYPAARSRGTTVIKVPAKGATTSDAANAESDTDDVGRVSSLEEENKLLREQLELRQQLNQQQQQQQMYPELPPAPVGGTMQPGVPPPSYGSVVSE